MACAAGVQVEVDVSDRALGGANLASICSTAHEARLLTIAQPSFFGPTHHCAQVIERGVKRHCEGITGHYDQSPEHSAISIHLPLLRRRAIVCMLPLTREGCRDFRRGDGSDLPSAGIYFIKPTSPFCRSNHPHRLCANMRMSGN